jgi:hypothetical protein
VALPLVRFRCTIHFVADGIDIVSESGRPPVAANGCSSPAAPLKMAASRQAGPR